MMKNLKKGLLALALMATVSVSYVYATNNTPVKKQPANVYTYYLEDDCSNPISCSPEYSGPVCAIEFEGSRVYSEPGCEAINEVTAIIGRKQP